MSCELSYSSLVSNHLFRDQESRSAQQRKRNILYLIENYLRSENLSETLCCLQKEARLSEQYILCDNIDLDCILQEYEDYYCLRFSKHPKITKKVDPPVERLDRKFPQNRGSKKLPPRVKSAPAKPSPLDKTPGEALADSLIITPAQYSPPPRVEFPSLTEYPEEWRPFVETISQEIITGNVNTQWSDVIGLDSAKQLLHEAVVYPIRYPDLFNGLLSPWRGILLHGPPGNGKTLLAKAIATECSATLFNISASSLISKWRGDSEKLVRVLFSLARRLAPSTIFIDEIDALMSTRDSDDHEASRRLKSELLIQLDGLHTSEAQVFLLATSNIPWQLDMALLRRFEKRILVDTPDLNARIAMLKYYLPPVVNENPRLTCELNYPALAQAMEQYSGADIKIVAKEVAMQRVREVFETLERMAQGGNNAQMKSFIKLKPITTQQVLSTLEYTKPCADYKRYHEQWQNSYGAK